VDALSSRVVLLQAMLACKNMLHDFPLLQLELVQGCIPIVRIDFERVCIVRVNVQDHGKMVRMHSETWIPLLKRSHRKRKFIRGLLGHSGGVGRGERRTGHTGRIRQWSGLFRTWIGRTRFAKGHLGWHLCKNLLPADLVSFDVHFDCTSDSRIQQIGHETHGCMERLNSAPMIVFR
jgi:hypothetical protein